jgi:hypothetical protein
MYLSWNYCLPKRPHSQDLLKIALEIQSRISTSRFIETQQATPQSLTFDRRLVLVSQEGDGSGQMF